MEDLVGRQFGPYRVVAPLGQGGMASVYKAFQPAVNRYVALKVLSPYFTRDPQFANRFRHEATLVAQLQHPHILPVFDFGESDGYAYLAMPFIDAGTLANTLTGRPIPFDVVERVIRQVADALDYAHAKGIVHRDIKPANVLLDERGNCLLADFGIARITEGATRLTTTGTIMGTPEYMSPEQASGETAGPASDIYSLGIVLYEMVTGRVPFRADTPLAVAIKHVTAPLPPPRAANASLTPGVEAVVLKALARAPADRFSSAAELSTSLAAALGAARDMQRQETVLVRPAQREGSLSPPATVAETHDAQRPAAQPRNNRAWLVLLAAIGLTAAVVVGMRWRSNPSPTPSTSSEPPVAAPPGATMAIDWATSGRTLNGTTGDTRVVSCPPDGSQQAVWGNGIYTGDSSLCTAAVHAGLITLERGGTVTVEQQGRQSVFGASERNGVTSIPFGPFGNSFLFHAANGQPLRLDAPGETSMVWNAPASFFAEAVGTTYTLRCPANGESAAVWGTDVYTLDSSPCTAAVHAGRLSFERGGVMTIEIRDGQASYSASERNGVGSLAFGPYRRSFTFARAGAQ